MLSTWLKDKKIAGVKDHAVNLCVKHFIQIRLYCAFGSYLNAVFLVIISYFVRYKFTPFYKNSSLHVALEETKKPSQKNIHYQIRSRMIACTG